MSAVLGLSLTSDDVVWALVDADGVLLDHDALDTEAADETAGAAARGACAIARAIGVEIERVRLTWRAEVARDGLRLRTRLAILGFEHVETVPMAAAMAAPVHPDATDMSPRLALAYGAARAAAGEAPTAAAPESSSRPRRTRRRIVTAVLGAAAAAMLGVLLLSAQPGPGIEPATAAVPAEAATPPDPGWVAVPAPSNAAGAARRVVATPVYAQQPAVVAPQFSAPVQQPTPAVAVAPAPEPAPAEVQDVAPAVAVAPAAEPDPASAPTPTELTHLPDTHLAAAADSHLPTATDPTAAPLPGPDMTDLVNVFTALP